MKPQHIISLGINSRYIDRYNRVKVVTLDGLSVSMMVQLSVRHVKER